MTAALASIDDLEARMGPVVDAARALAALEDASNLINVTTDGVWLIDDAVVPSIAVTICCAVARRILDNPQGITAGSTTLGPYAESSSYANPSADVYLTSNEQRLLRRATGGSAVGSITLESPYPMATDTTVYVPWVDETSEAFPMGPFPSSA